VRVVFTGGGTGGHLYPGLAIARALVRARSDIEPHFIGAQRGIEQDVLPKTEFEYTLLDMHPLYRSQPLNNWRTLRGGLQGWSVMAALAKAQRPAIIVGTGGYASAVPILWGRANGVPVVQHIGDAFPGVAARTFARLSVECYLGFPEAESRLPGGRYVVTGNPIEPPPTPRPDRSALLAKFGFAPDARVLLVFGGSQGSSYINEVVATWSRDHLPDGWSVLWGTGKATYANFQALDRPRVRVIEYIAPIADAYAIADLALVRGGMMGTAELCAWGVPMIVVPLPTAAADHQTWNAKSLEAAGAAIHVPQKELTPAKLDQVIGDLIKYPTRLAALTEGALRRAKPEAAVEIAQRISALVPR
jgi:UDP-N-acetylglucosamine--N-acetylmuramyl-(pentapeptide) pyrophosphoryl-undecaprenol N-acetylglucosamine transferase